MDRERFHLTNLQTVDRLYRDYRKDPASVDTRWHPFFLGMEFASEELDMGGDGIHSLMIYRLITAYRTYGHLYAQVNPIHTGEHELPKELTLEVLGFKKSQLKEEFPTLGFLPEEKAPLEKIITALQNVYSSRIGFEYMETDNHELEEWMQKRIEPRLLIDLSIEDKKYLLELLNKAEVFESFLHMKYTGQKRFSLEGGETLIPILAGMIEEGAEKGMEDFILGMAHRGRLNVLTNIMQKSYPVIFHEFEGATLPLSTEGASDVKYHKGFSSETTTRYGKKVHLYLTSNPSHLESVDPVVLGKTKANQIVNGDLNQEKAMGVLIHGDAALAGQGIIYECLQLMNVDGYSTGGTLHIVINNQIGFTTLPNEYQSMHYCTDIAKTFGCPVFHVNAEDPESCFYVAKMALQIRQTFKRDVFIDLICYRKYGHNEGDEPHFTQPLQYHEIDRKKNIRELYKQQMIQEGVVEKEIAEALEKDFKQALQEHLEESKKFKEEPPALEKVHGHLVSDRMVSNTNLFEKIDTAVPLNILKQITERSYNLPQGFTPHSKLIKWAKDRLTKLNGDPTKNELDYAFCEHLAFGSLLWEGIAIRLSGQDTQRGTFSQRHAVWVDQKTSEKFFPLKNLKEDQGRFDVINSTLSEYAAMGFEYGYSWFLDNALVLWEAQYGDFANGGQIIIDQFITTGEQKWRRYSSLVLLLPHGLEGQGPEHSSARLERFLILCGHNNIQVVYPSTPAQLFHLLRRQALGKYKKPLIVFTPKGLLRLSACASSLNELTRGSFEEFLHDPMEIEKPQRLLICSGRIFYDLLEERAKKKTFQTAIFRVEQFYPFNEEKFEKMLAKYKGFQECFWIQEEPQNMGGWNFMSPFLQKYLGKIQYIGRERCASPATGSALMHKKEQESILSQAFERK